MTFTTEVTKTGPEGTTTKQTGRFETESAANANTAKVAAQHGATRDNSYGPNLCVYTREDGPYLLTVFTSVVA
jgi:hypothetical protein